MEESSLAKQVSEIQDKCELPGLVAECKKYIQEYKLPNILKVTLTSTEWKTQVKKKMRDENSKELKLQMSKSAKLCESQLPNEDFGQKE